MSRSIPMRVFDASEAPVLAADAAGSVLYANRAATDLFVPAGDQVQGRPCWQVTRFRDLDGRAFCRRDCPIRRQAVLGRMPVMQRVVRGSGRGTRRFDLWNFLVPPAPGRGCLVLHFVAPGSDDATPRPAPTLALRRPASNRLHLLSARELQVLEDLAGGCDAVQVADRLAISVNTTRNHIRHIFRKLNLHRQVDAILLFLDVARSARRSSPLERSAR